MRWAVGGLVLFVLAAMLLAPGADETPAPPDPPPTPEAGPDPAPPPVIRSADPAVGPEEPAPEDAPSALPVDPADHLVRLVDARTKAPVANLFSLVITWDDRRRGARYARRSRVGWRTLESDWIVLPRLGRDTGDHAILELGLPGYRRATVDLRTAPPRSVIALSPADPTAHGTVDLPEGKLDREVQVTIHSRGEAGSLPEFAVLVVHWAGNEHTSDGPLMLYDLPDGDWIIEITAVVDGAVVSAKKTITVHDGAADFGEIDLTPWAGIRARVVDADGTVVPQATVRMCREEEDETKSRTGTADEDGWVSFRDFEPGKWHRVAAGGLPGPLSKLVLAPEKRGDVTSVALEWPDRLVRCDLAFDIEPGAGETLASLDGPVTVTPIFALSPSGARFLLLPGEYVWTATLTKNGESRRLKARLVVPQNEDHAGVVRFR